MHVHSRGLSITSTRTQRHRRLSISAAPPLAALWYLGNYYYNVYNKLSAKASGGAEFAFTLAWLQLLVGSVYAIFLWAAPEARPRPNVRGDTARSGGRPAALPEPSCVPRCR